jgi:hypothetical protein
MDVQDGLGDGGVGGIRESAWAAEPLGATAAGPAGAAAAGTAAADAIAGSPAAGDAVDGAAAGDAGARDEGARDGGAGGGPAEGAEDGGGAGRVPAGGTMTVEVDGEARELPAERDYTGDGRPDAAAETSDGRVIVFADTEDNETGAAGPDGRADEAYVVDKQTGRVVGAAHLDPRTGEWVEGTGSDGPAGDPEPTPAGAGAGGPGVASTETGGPGTGRAATATDRGGAAAGEAGAETGERAEAPAPGPSGELAGPDRPTGVGEPAAAPGAGSGTMTVDLGGQPRELPAERDYTGDGRPDAAAETADGKVVVFADTEDNETGAARPDGRADEAYVVDKQTGRVLGAAHLDPRTGEWVEGTDDPPAPAGAGGEVDS